MAQGLYKKSLQKIITDPSKIRNMINNNKRQKKENLKTK